MASDTKTDDSRTCQRKYDVKSILRGSYSLVQTVFNLKIYSEMRRNVLSWPMR